MTTLELIRTFVRYVGMLTVGEIEIIRRSAAMARLSKDETFRVLEVCDRLVRERQQIAALLAHLPTSFGAVRDTLNELQRIVG